MASTSSENVLDNKDDASPPARSISIHDSRGRRIWEGNWNIYWVLGSVLGLWFTIGRGIPSYFHKTPGLSSPKIGPAFGMHVIFACVTIWIMIWNLFHTPSHGKIYRNVHVFLGRLALFTGLVSTITGFISVWYERYRSSATGFNIGISIGGIIQVSSQLLGLYYIRKGNVDRHMRHMIGAFFGGCLVPSIMRLPDLVGTSFGDSWPSYSWVFPLLLIYPSLMAIKNKRWY